MSNQNRPDGSKSPAISALALAAAFLGAPWLYGVTEPYVTPILERNYGYGFADLYRLGWGVTTAAVVYFMSLEIIRFIVMIVVTTALYRFV